MASRVFGYGSLTAAGGEPAVLRGYRRLWNVAMDNSVDLESYKHYLDVDGNRPAIFVAYLNIEPDDGTVEGRVLEVEDLEPLDARERNYERIEVDVEPHGKVWTYIGTAAARARFEEGLASGTAVVDQHYLALTGATTAELPCPAVALTRIDD